MPDTESNSGHNRPTSRLRWLAFLKPNDPQEALALVSLCVLLVGLGAGAVKAIETLTDQEPWRIRADRICLRAGDEFLAVDGGPRQRLQAQIQLTEDTLEELRAVGESVPIPSTLAFQTMLSYKEDILDLLERKLTVLRAGATGTQIDGRIQGTFLSLYGPKAEELGLHVCGQGTGDQ